MRIFFSIGLLSVRVVGNGGLREQRRVKIVVIRELFRSRVLQSGWMTYFFIVYVCRRNQICEYLSRQSYRSRRGYRRYLDE